MKDFTEWWLGEGSRLADEIRKSAKIVLKKADVNKFFIRDIFGVVWNDSRANSAQLTRPGSETSPKPCAECKEYSKYVDEVLALLEEHREIGEDEFLIDQLRKNLVPQCHIDIGKIHWGMATGKRTKEKCPDRCVCPLCNAPHAYAGGKAVFGKGGE